MENQNYGAEVIRKLLESKKFLNSRYSLKALGRDLKVSQPQLTKIISGERTLTPQVAVKIGRHIKMEDGELLKFILSTIDANSAIA
jgi:plasmid maintenance system antidote protein VapI